MKIDVIKLTFMSNGSESSSYKISNIVPCCEALIDNPLIDFFYQTTENTDNPLVDEYDYGYDLGVMLMEDKHYDGDGYYDDYGYDEQYYYKLKFCPFCGEKIEVNVVDEIDMTEEYAVLEKERDVIHKKCCKTDSKKKESECLAQRHILDHKINEFYNTDVFASYFEKEKE